MLNRAFKTDPPTRATGGAAYLRYQFTPKFSLGTRFAVLEDSGGIFSGTSQTLKDTTLTATYQIADGVQTKWEYRRDFSNVAVFSDEHSGPAQEGAEHGNAGGHLVVWRQRRQLVTGFSSAPTTLAEV